MRFFSILTVLIFIVINFKSVNSSVLNSANTMTCLEFYTSNDLMDKAGQSSFFAKEILYVQYIFDKDVPIYNYTGDFGYEEDIKCLDGKCSIHQKVDDALLLLTTFKEAGQR